jgi:hypothetical protein
MRSIADCERVDRPPFQAEASKSIGREKKKSDPTHRRVPSRHAPGLSCDSVRAIQVWLDLRLLQFLNSMWPTQNTIELNAGLPLVALATYSTKPL